MMLRVQQIIRKHFLYTRAHRRQPRIKRHRDERVHAFPAEATT